MTEHRSPHEWGEVYDQLRPTYVAFVGKLEVLLETLLADAGLGFHYSYNWTWGRSDFVERIFGARRAGRVIHDPLTEWTDFAGVTFVVTCANDLEALLALVAQEFEIEEDSSIPVMESSAAGEQLGPSDGPAYPFPHVVISLPASRASQTEWRPYHGLHARIEAQTMFQSGWETIDQDELPYEQDSSYPDGFRLAVADAARRFAAADEAIVQIRRELDRAYAGYEDALAAGDLTLELNAHSLDAYFRLSDTARELFDVGERAGLTTDQEPGTWQVAPIMLWLLAKYEIRSIAELDSFLREALDRAKDIFSDLIRIARTRGGVPWAGAWSVVLLMLVLARADSETVALANLIDPIEFAVNTLIGNAVADPDHAG